MITKKIGVLCIKVVARTWLFIWEDEEDGSKQTQRMKPFDVYDGMANPRDPQFFAPNAFHFYPFAFVC